MNTMVNDIRTAKELLLGTGISLSDAARLIRQMLDFKGEGEASSIQFCTRVIQQGLVQRHIKQKRVDEGFVQYVASKQHLRPDSLRDIRYLGKRLMAARPDLAQRDFAAISLSDCEQWLQECFTTPSQFNKGRAMLHGLFQFAACREWCERNPLRYLAKKRIIEQEIKPLPLPEIEDLLEQSQEQQQGECAAAVSLLIWAGLRPSELRRLCWGDIDLQESCITIRSQCSKTGGTRQVDICRPLHQKLKQQARHIVGPHQSITPPNWYNKWKRIREAAGFKSRWVQDVLRHCYASYHAKYYKNLPLLQLNMGHRDQNLLRARYVNMAGITQADAKRFFKMGYGERGTLS